MDERIEELFPLYALGALTDEERAQVDAYVSVNPDARARLAELVDAAAAVPFGVTPVEPSPDVKKALMERVQADVLVPFAPARPVEPSRARSWRAALFRPLPLLAGASLLAAILAVVWAISLNAEVTRLKQENAALTAQVDDLEAQNAVLQQELLAREQVIALLSSPGVRAMAIAGTEHQPGASGQLIADPRNQSGVLVVTGLSTLPAGQVYQFWLIDEGVPVGAGTFSVDEQGDAVLEVTASAPIGSFDAMGVSIEPEGGSEQPTGAIVMLSTLS